MLEAMSGGKYHFVIAKNTLNSIYFVKYYFKFRSVVWYYASRTKQTKTGGQNVDKRVNGLFQLSS